MKSRVRRYRDSDLPAMREIWNEVVNAGQAFPQERPESVESAREFFQSQTYCGVAENARGEITGLYILHPNNIGRCGHICNASYAVAANERGKGTGRLLVEDSLRIAGKAGFRIMQFNAVASDNLAANSLYSSLGFVLLGSVPGGFRRPDGSFQEINLYYRALDDLS